MPTEIPIKWSAIADFATLTNLASLADGNIWQSGEQNDASPTAQLLRIYYEIAFNATPVSGDSLNFHILGGDEAASNEIWEGGIGTSEGQITSAAAKAAVFASSFPVKIHAWQTSHGATFKGSFTLQDFPPSWQLLVHANGEALASSGHRLRYQYGVPEAQ